MALVKVRNGEEEHREGSDSNLEKHMTHIRQNGSRVAKHTTAKHLKAPGVKNNCTTLHESTSCSRHQHITFVLFVIHGI